MSLLEAVSSPESAALHDIEEFGRVASASGFTLAILGLFVAGGFRVRGAAQWTLFALALAVCAFPFVATGHDRWVLIPVGLGAAMDHELIGDAEFGWLLPSSSMMAGFDSDKPDHVLPERWGEPVTP